VTPKTAAAGTECGPLPAAAAPDLLDALLAAHRGELELRPEEGGAMSLVVTAPALDMYGAIHCGSRRAMTDLVTAWNRMRCDQRNGPQRCECGELYAAHNWDRRRAPCERSGCAGYRAGAVSA
jgi:hypothetical protein